MDKIYATLGVTKGYVQKKLPEFFCPTCAEAGARRKGLRKSVHNCEVQLDPSLKCYTGSHVTFELDDTDEIAGAIDAECIRDADDLQELEYVADTLGRSRTITAEELPRHLANARRTPTHLTPKNRSTWRIPPS